MLKTETPDAEELMLLIRPPSFLRVEPRRAAHKPLFDPLEAALQGSIVLFQIGETFIHLQL